MGHEKISDAVGRSAAERGVQLPELPMEARLPIFEIATSTLYRSNDGGLEVLPMQYGYGKPTFEVRHDGEPVFCTHERVLADAFVAGYDLAAEATKELLASLKPKRGLTCGHQSYVVDCDVCLAAHTRGEIPLGEVEAALAAHLRSGAAFGADVVESAPTEPNPRCPSCDRVMSWREHNEQGACNDCNGGAWDGGIS